MPNSAELTGWLAYLKVDDEVRAQQTAYAIAKAFGGDKKLHADNSRQKAVEAEEEEVIDTTDPNFVKRFQGFTYGDKPQKAQNRVPTNTEIKIG